MNCNWKAGAGKTWTQPSNKNNKKRKKEKHDVSPKKVSPKKRPPRIDHASVWHLRRTLCGVELHRHISKLVVWNSWRYACGHICMDVYLKMYVYVCMYIFFPVWGLASIRINFYFISSLMCMLFPVLMRPPLVIFFPVLIRPPLLIFFPRYSFEFGDWHPFI